MGFERSAAYRQFLADADFSPSVDAAEVVARWIGRMAATNGDEAIGDPNLDAPQAEPFRDCPEPPPLAAPKPSLWGPPLRPGGERPAVRHPRRRPHRRPPRDGAHGGDRQDRHQDHDRAARRRHAAGGADRGKERRGPSGGASWAAAAVARGEGRAEPGLGGSARDSDRGRESRLTDHQTAGGRRGPSAAVGAFPGLGRIDGTAGRYTLRSGAVRDDRTVDRSAPFCSRRTGDAPAARPRAAVRSAPFRRLACRVEDRSRSASSSPAYVRLPTPPWVSPDRNGENCRCARYRRRP